MDLMGSLSREAAATATAATGVIYDPEAPWQQLGRVLEMTSGNRPSMLQDIESGNMTEIEAISGEILRHGQRASLELPCTETVYRLVKALEMSVR